MGGFFGVSSKNNCIRDVFYGVDYHSHLGTRRGGLAVYDKEIGLQREIHNIENSPFRTKFQDVFDDESLHVTDETTAADVDGWDSLEHIDLMASVERAFGIRFSMGEITRMKNVGEMADLILEKREQ